jgi:hypothetical protein
LGPLASLTRVDACNPPTAIAPDLGAGRTRRPRDFHLSHARLRPPRLSPLRARPRARPIWLGHAAHSLVGLRTPLSRNADKQSSEEFSSLFSLLSNLVLFTLTHIIDQVCVVLSKICRITYSPPLGAIKEVPPTVLD